MVPLVGTFVSAVRRQHDVATREVCPECFEADYVSIVRVGRRKQATCGWCGTTWRYRRTWDQIFVMNWWLGDWG